MSISNTQPFYFGMYGDTWSGWYPLNGDLDDYRFYERLLSDDEMIALYLEEESTRAVVSIQSGKWKDKTTWECGRIPKIANQTIIQSGHIVNLSTTNSTRLLTLNGSLEFKVERKAITSQ